MPDRFSREGKRVSAVYIKETVDGKTRYRREQYNLVTYNADLDPNAPSYIEPLGDPALQPGRKWEDIVDDIQVYETAPPFPKSRIGGF